MTGQSVADAAKGGRGKTVATREPATLTEFIQTYQGDFARVVPAHVNVEAFVGLATAYVRRDPTLNAAAKANPASLILALRHCAALGHMPVKGIYALVPFNNRKAPGGKEVVGIEEYRGVVERMYRAGGVRAVKVEVGREGDPVFRFNRTRMALPEHEYDEFASDEDRGPLKAVYAWAVMLDGTISQVAWLNRHEIAKHRAVSRSGDSFWGPPWPGEGPWTQDMWKKTGMHVLERFVPTSSEYRWQVAAAESQASTGFKGLPDVPVSEYGPSPDDGDVVDAEVVPDGHGPAPVDEGWPETAKPGGAP
jgi:recombination protein RecT